MKTISELKNWSVHSVKKGWTHLKTQPEMTKFQKAWRYAATAALAVLAAFLAMSFVYFLWLLLTFDPLGGIPKDSTLIMDREKNLLYTIHGEENRKTVDSLEEISPQLVDATLAIEDDQFYHHFGIDIPGLIKAVFSQIGIGSARGGSTITQQFVRNEYLSLEKSYIRKYREIMMSFVLEMKFSKDQILLMYLNEIPYGNNAYGIELASERYFGKKASEMDLAESALLASIPNAPTYYSPYGEHKYSTLNFELNGEILGDRKISGEIDLAEDEFDRGLIGQTFTMPDSSTFYLKGRSDIVLERMEELGMITQSEVESALAEIQTTEFTAYRDTIEAAHFVMWVKQHLEDKYGKELVEQGGLRVYTTLDPDFQKAAEEAVSEQWKKNKDNYNIDNAALISVQPQTGQILAMVGSASYLEDSEKPVVDGQVNMITSARQPGSSFKPFVYALAFLNQYTPATVIYDVLTHFGTDTPKNYEGSFQGPLSMREALGGSRNIPAAKTYFLAGQQEGIIPFVHKLGLESIPEDGDFGYTLALGTAEVSPMEMAEAYGVFANNGTKIPLSSILRVETSDGTVLEQWDESKVEKTQVLDPQVAYLINDILSDPSVNIGPGVYLDAIDNAAKTGTPTDSVTGNAKDGWIAAYTPTLVTIGWSGNADGTPMSSAGEAYYTIAPIWKNYMNKILTRLEPTEWARPSGITDIAVSKASGKLPGSSTPSDMVHTEIFADFAVPTEIDDAFQNVKIETVTNRLATEYSPADAVEEKSFRIYKEDWSNWQNDIDAWVKEQAFEMPPTEFAEDIHNAETASHVPTITIVSPSSLSGVSKADKLVDVQVEISSTGNGLSEVVYTVNGVLPYHAKNAPYDGKIRIPVTSKSGDILEVQAKVVDQYGYSSTSTIELRVEESSSEDSATLPLPGLDLPRPWNER